MKLTKLILPGVVAAGGLAVLTGGLTSYADTATSTSSTSSKPANNDPQKKDGGVITTDSTVISAVTDAVTAKYSGATVDRVAKLPAGSYLAFSVQSSGTKTIVSLDSSYQVTSTKDVPADKSGTPPQQSSSSSSSDTTAQ